MGAGVKAAEHGRYTTPTDDVRRRHGLLPRRTGLIYRIMMAHGGVPHSHGELIHRSAWNRNSQKFAPGFRRWHHACGGKGCPAWEVDRKAEDLMSYLASLIRRYPLVALVVLAITRGKTGVVTLLRRMVRWRVGLRWYAVAVLLPVAIALATAVFNVLLGAQAPSAVELGGWTGLFSTFFILLLIPGLGGTWEEPGWRGYALPHLQVGLSALLASLILGVLWAFWHLPLMVVGEVPWSDIVFVISWTIVFTWLFNNS